MTKAVCLSAITCRNTLNAATELIQILDSSLEVSTAAEDPIQPSLGEGMELRGL